MNKSNQNLKKIAVLLVPGILMIFLFQNCSKVGISGTDELSSQVAGTGNNTSNDPSTPIETPTDPNGLTDPSLLKDPSDPITLIPVVPIVIPGVVVTPPTTPIVSCDKISCDLTPLTLKPAVTTILLTLGDQANSELVINGASSQLIAETVVRYTSPILNPKVLVVFDSLDFGEDPEDRAYLTNVLLSRYHPVVMQTASGGLTAADVAGYDVVWYNNPGHPMSSLRTLQTLLAFKGGVILQGDDLAHGEDGSNKFSLSALTGLNYIDNGVSVVCGSKSYAHDDNSAYQYRVSIDPNKILGVSASTLNFKYGNDIDNTSVVGPEIEIIASAIGGGDNCTEKRPTIVRYYKK